MRDDEWYYAGGGAGERVGPMTGDVLRGFLLRGELPHDVLVWRDGMADWSPARTVADLSHVIAGVGVAPVAAGTATLPYRFGSMDNAPPAQLGYYGPRQDVVRYAGFWIRFLAAFVDGLITTVAGMLLGFILGGILGGVMGALGLPSQEIRLAASIVGQVVGYVVAWLYEALLTSSSYQGTLMKYALGLKVTDLEGNRISFGRATGRHFAKFLSALLLLIGYIMAAFTERKQALHDMMASTVVVYR
jgi:uncharacterized RDD family membrane protein YckC